MNWTPDDELDAQDKSWTPDDLGLADITPWFGGHVLLLMSTTLSSTTD